MVVGKVGPAIRGGLSRALLTQVRRLPAGQRDSVLNALPPRVLRVVDEAFATTWISLDDHMALSDSVRAALGPEGNIAIWSETMIAAYQQPLLASFVRMTRSLFDLTPASTIKQSPRIYSHLTRQAGVVGFENRERFSSVTLRAYPAHRYHFICYVEGLAGCIRGGFTSFGLEGELSIGALDEAKGSARYDIAW